MNSLEGIISLLVEAQRPPGPRSVIQFPSFSPGPVYPLGPGGDSSLQLLSFLEAGRISCLWMGWLRPGRGGGEAGAWLGWGLSVR